MSIRSNDRSSSVLVVAASRQNPAWLDNFASESNLTRAERARETLSSLKPSNESFRSSWWKAMASLVMHVFPSAPPRKDAEMLKDTL